MIKKMTCTKCPKGCQLLVDVENSRVVGVSGNACPKGDAYGRQEVEHPMRLLTSSVLTQGLEMKMVPVRTSAPVPKERMMDIMEALKAARVTTHLPVGGLVIKNVLDLNVDIIVTRSVF